jgi:hypothetical protein
MGLRLSRLEVQETDTSVVVHTREDRTADSRVFGPKQYNVLP